MKRKKKKIAGDAEAKVNARIETYIIDRTPEIEIQEDTQLRDLMKTILSINSESTEQQVRGLLTTADKICEFKRYKVNKEIKGVLKYHENKGLYTPKDKIEATITDQIRSRFGTMVEAIAKEKERERSKLERVEAYRKGLLTIRELYG